MTSHGIRFLVALGLPVLVVTAQPVAHAGPLMPGGPTASTLVQPLPGSGSGGAFGPAVINSLQELPNAGTQAQPLKVPPPTHSPALNPSYPVPATSLQVPSSDASTTGGLSTESASPSSPTRTPSSNFTSYWTQDVAGASDGRYILQPSLNNGLTNGVVIRTLSGSLVKFTPSSSFWCGGPTPLPICSMGGFDGDDRALYDPGSSRWIITALQVFSSSSVATDLLAVSQTSDPTAGWNLYQFPACGAFDTSGGSDQPHTGFNNQWIVVTSACSASSQGVNGAGLAVFDKSAVYSGASLNLNQNWFEFVDPYSGGPYSGIGGGNGTRDNPTSTYTPTTNNREYLTVSTLNGSSVSVIYSYIEGATDAPAFTVASEVVTPSFKVSFPPAVDAPGCIGCMVSLANTWIHSSGVWAFASGTPYILSTMVLGDPQYQNATQIISVAANTQTGVATALRLTGGADGAGAMASEIAMPLVRTDGADEALIAYDFSASDFYPGVKSATWNVDRNTVRHLRVLRQGSFTPAAGTFQRNRWVDFIDALVPIPGSSSLMVGGTLATPSANTSQGSTYWAVVTL